MIYKVFRRSIADLKGAVERFLNEAPSPFCWKADPHEIIADVKS